MIIHILAVGSDVTFTSKRRDMAQRSCVKDDSLLRFSRGGVT